MRRIIFFHNIAPIFLYSAHNRTPKFRTLIVGRVFDPKTKSPLEYATVIAYRLKDSVNDTDMVVISSFGNPRFSRNPLGVRGGMNLKLTKSDLLNIGIKIILIGEWKG